jgi:hypothetical protein
MRGAGASLLSRRADYSQRRPDGPNGPYLECRTLAETRKTAQLSRQSRGIVILNRRHRSRCSVEVQTNQGDT